MEVLAFLSAQGGERRHHGVVEICGGEARVSQIHISRRNYAVGPNFDLATGADLLDESPRTISFRVDMCAAGLKGPETELPILKASETLVQQFLVQGESG